MKVSVIIPCYNSEKWIEQAIVSAMAQKTNFDFEVLVRDDFSTDNSQRIIERVAEYSDGVVRYYRPFENWNEIRNVKFLLSQATGKYIAHLDGDDYYTTLTKLQRQVDFMDANPDYILTFTGGWHLSEDGTYAPPEIGTWLGHPIERNDDVSTQDLSENGWVTFGRVYRNVPNLVQDWMVEGWQKTIWYLDWATSYELSKRGKVRYLDFPSVVSRIRSQGTFFGLTMVERLRRGQIQRCALVAPICESCHKQPATSEHTYPYKEDINGDNITLCNCCDSCRYNCLMDI